MEPKRDSLTKNMTPEAYAAFRHYVDQIEPWAWVNILNTCDPETIAEFRTDFLHMANLLQAIINSQSQKE